MTRITNEGLAAKMESIKEYNAENFRDIKESLLLVNKSIIDLNVKVGIQNGRVKKLEDIGHIDHVRVEDIVRIQENCPGKKLEERYERELEKRKNNPAGWILDNWKPALIIFLLSLLSFVLIPGLALKVWSWLAGIQIEVGL
jgi:hypothetical protein